MKELEIPDLCQTKVILQDILVDKIFSKNDTKKINFSAYKDYIKDYNFNKISISKKTITRNLNKIKTMYSSDDAQNECEMRLPNPALNPSTPTKNDDIPNLFRKQLKYLLDRFTFSNRNDTSFENIEVSESFFPLLFGIVGSINQSKNNWSNWSKFRQDTLAVAKDVLQIKYKNKPISTEYSNAEWVEYASYLLEFYFSDSILDVAKKLVSMKTDPYIATRTNALNLISKLPDLKFETMIYQNTYYRDLLDKLNNPDKSNNYEIALVHVCNDAIPEYEENLKQENYSIHSIPQSYYSYPVSKLLEIIKSEN